jgi:cellulose synthase/poly-beta-1,6-N-acetylglucosamine synthase-like glycosyltransferase
MGLYRFAQAGPGAGRHSYVSMIALILKNVVRPLGLHVLRMPCLLNGSGSAYPRDLLRRIRIGGGSIAEDYDMSVELARLGHAPVLEPRARILSRLPGNDVDGLRQRRRWEHGHLQLAFASAPRLLLESVRTRRPELAQLALELAVPPLAVLLALGALALGVCGLQWLVSGASLLFAVAAVTVVTFLLVLLLTVVRFTTMKDGWQAARCFPAYFLSKLPLYRDFLVRRETRWLRSVRG